MKEFGKLVERTMTVRQRLASAEKAIVELSGMLYATRKALEKTVAGLEILTFEAKEILNDPDVISVIVPSCGVGSSGVSRRPGTK